MADISSDRVIYETDILLDSNTTVEFGKSYIITTASTITLPNQDMISGGTVSFAKRQGVSPLIQVLSGSGHVINVIGKLQGTELLMDLEVILTLTWNDSELRWEVV